MSKFKVKKLPETNVKAINKQDTSKTTINK